MEGIHTIGYKVLLQCSINHIFRHNYYLKPPVLYNMVYQTSSSFTRQAQRDQMYQSQWWLFSDHLYLYSLVSFQVSNPCVLFISDDSNLWLTVSVLLFWLHLAHWNIILLQFYQTVPLRYKVYKNTHHYKWDNNSTYSVTRKYLFWSWKNSYNFKMFGWSNCFRMSISLRSFCFSSSASRFLFIILTALNALVSLCKHFLTSPYAPKLNKNSWEN